MTWLDNVDLGNSFLTFYTLLLALLLKICGIVLLLFLLIHNFYQPFIFSFLCEVQFFFFKCVGLHFVVACFSTNVCEHRCLNFIFFVLVQNSSICVDKLCSLLLLCRFL
jgi:hypothetical protein